MTASPFERLRDYRREGVLEAFAPGRIDGPFLLGTGRAACLVRVSRAADGPRFPSRSNLLWPTSVPAETTAPLYPVDVLVERVPGTFVYVGEAHLGSYRTADRSHASFALREMLPRDIWLEAWRVTRDGPTATPSPIEPIGSLRPTSTSADRLRALRTFVERWYAPRTQASPVSGRSSRIPGSLEELHRIVAGAMEVFGQNILLGLHELVPSEGRLIFFRENQGVFEWATELEGDDPPVWIRESRAWKPLHVPLSEFAIQMVLAEAIICSACGAWTVVDQPIAQQLLSRLEPLPLSEWTWPPVTARFYGRGAALVQIWESDGEPEEVRLAARDPRDLDFAEDLVDDSWDRVAF